MKKRNKESKVVKLSAIDKILIVFSRLIMLVVVLLSLKWLIELFSK